MSDEQDRHAVNIVGNCPNCGESVRGALLLETDPDGASRTIGLCWNCDEMLIARKTDAGYEIVDRCAAATRRAERAEAQAAVLREALGPFAEIGKSFDDLSWDSWLWIEGGERVYVEDLQRARAALVTDAGEGLVKEMEALRAALADMLDAADRQRQGSPLDYEEWALRRDAARKALDATVPGRGE